MVSFLAKVKFFRFWPKTMDYSQAFWAKLKSFFVAFLLLAGRRYEVEIVPFCSPLDVLLHEIIVCQNQNFQFLAENHGLYIVHGFDRFRSH